MRHGHRRRWGTAHRAPNSGGSTPIPQKCCISADSTRPGLDSVRARAKRACGGNGSYVTAGGDHEAPGARAGRGARSHVRGRQRHRLFSLFVGFRTSSQSRFSASLFLFMCVLRNLDLESAPIKLKSVPPPATPPLIAGNSGLWRIYAVAVASCGIDDVQKLRGR